MVKLKIYILYFYAKILHKMITFKGWIFKSKKMNKTNNDYYRYPLE